MNTTLLKNSMIFGIILGLIFFIPHLIGYFFNLTIMLNGTELAVIILSSIILGILNIGFSKSKLSGIINLKECFGSYIVMISLGLTISVLTNFITFKVITNDFGTTLKDRNIELIEKYMIDIKKDKKLIDQEKKQMLDNASKDLELTKEIEPYSFSTLASNRLKFFPILAIFGILISFILKTPKKV